MTFRGLAAGVVLIVTGVMCAEAHAADARLLRVVLLRSADRISLALELSAEPQKASLRALSDRILELETGPVIGPVRGEELAPASGVPVIKQVTIREYSSEKRAVFVRARMILHGSTRADVRITGRVVYVDFAVPVKDSPLPTFQEIATAAGEPARQAERHVRSRVDRPALSDVERPAPSNVGGDTTYRDAVQPLVARLAEIGSFLLSVTAAPANDVLAAVGGTLTEVEGRLRAIDVPPESRQAHGQLLSGVAAASRAVAPDFRGDRVAQAHRALAMIEMFTSQESGVRSQESGGRTPQIEIGR